MLQAWMAVARKPSFLCKANTLPPWPCEPDGHLRSGYMNEDHEATWAWLVSDDGSKTPMHGTGLRIPLESDCWVAVDLQRHERGLLAVAVGVRAKREQIGGLPRLAIVPCAGNSASVLIGSPCAAQRPLEVVPVDEAELGGDVASWLSKTTSGDPIGEIMLAQPARPAVLARKLLLDQGDAGEVVVGIRASPHALLDIAVHAASTRPSAPGAPFACLEMVIRLHGSNLVSFLFRKGIATRVG